MAMTTTKGRCRPIHPSNTLFCKTVTVEQIERRREVAMVVVEVKYGCQNGNWLHCAVATAATIVTSSWVYHYEPTNVGVVQV